MLAEPYDSLYSVGDYLILELHSGDIFEGDYCCSCTDRIDIINTTSHNNPNTLKGIHSFYRNEIARIDVLKSRLENIPQAPVVIEEVIDKGRIKIPEDEYNRLRDMYTNYTYIEHTDDLYYCVIEKIRNTESIGVVGFGMNGEQTITISLLAISTWEEIFLFDMFHFRNYFNTHTELMNIFESDRICKVIHNAGLLIDILSKKYKVNTQNCFDTYVVDLVIQKNKSTISKKLEKGRDLSECLIHHLNFPNAVLQKALNVESDKWITRPLSDKKKEYAAQMAAYLITLRDAMQQVLFSEINGAFKNITKYVSKLSSYNFAKKTGNEVSEDVKKLVPFLKRNTIKVEDISGSM